MFITDGEFVRTNPMQVSRAAELVIDHPSDRPAYVGVLIEGASAMDPCATLQYTFKFTANQALELAAGLNVAATFVE